MVHKLSAPEQHQMCPSVSIISVWAPIGKVTVEFINMLKIVCLGPGGSLGSPVTGTSGSALRSAPSGRETQSSK